MNQDSRISLWQVVLLLCLSRMFSVMTMCMVYTSFTIQEMFYGALLAIPLAFLVFLPGGLLFQKRPRLLLDNRLKGVWMTGYFLLAVGWLLMTLLHLDFFWAMPSFSKLLPLRCCGRQCWPGAGAPIRGWKGWLGTAPSCFSFLPSVCCF